ncbi:hypothetical protein SH139x_005754 [Planctomycetaceae bacterium SH139]
MTNGAGKHHVEVEEAVEPEGQLAKPDTQPNSQEVKTESAKSAAADSSR